MFILDRAQHSTRSKTQEGFLQVTARIARTGIQEYTARELDVQGVEPDKIIRIYRPENEVFNDASMNSFKGKPCTFMHPPKLLDVKSAKGYTIGYSTDVRRDGDFLVADMVITDNETIEALENGINQVSNGYTANFDMTPGTTPDGEEYDGIQRNIVGNHIAILRKGRAGPQCRVNDEITNKEEEPKMATLLINGKLVTMDDDSVAHVQSFLDSAVSTAKDFEKLQAQFDQLKEQQSSFDAKPAIDQAIELVSKAKAIGSKVQWRDHKTSESFVRAVVDAQCKVEGEKSDAYYLARLDLLVESEQSKGADDMNSALSDMVADGAANSTPKTNIVDAAREAYAKRNRDAWKMGA